MLFRGDSQSPSSLINHLDWQLRIDNKCLINNSKTEEIFMFIKQSSMQFNLLDEIEWRQDNLDENELLDDHMSN